MGNIYFSEKDMSEVNDLVTQAHAKYDVGGKGHLTQAELKKLLDDIAKSIGFQGGVKDSQAEKVLKVLDDNNDGQIDVDELKGNIDKINAHLDFNFQPVFIKKIL